jgi:ribose 5-phosphate isomerase B
MKIYIGTDHAGFALKEELKNYLPKLGLGYEVEDLGSFGFNSEDDYPDFVKKVAEAVVGEDGSRGVILGGSGQGEAMCANRTPGIRACVFYGPHEMPLVGDKEERNADSFEIVKLAREHNDANILSLGARFITVDEAKFAVELFLSTKFSGEDRHVRRIGKF